MTKKITLLFALMLSTLMASAHDIEVKNADGVTIYYNYINNGTELEVTYQGSSYSSYSNEYQGNVVIPEEVTYMNRTRKVTSIGEYAFRGCSGLTSIEIPNSVTSIGSYAFAYCSGLTSVIIPNSVTSIGYGAFGFCSGLTSVTIGNSVTSIGEDAFFGCTGLTKVTLNNNAISSKSYSSSSTLRSIFGSQVKEYVLGDDVTSIGSYAFYNCSKVTSVTIADNVTLVGDYAFDGTAWYNNLPDGLFYAGKVAYKYKGTMPANTSIRIKEGTLGIGQQAFQNCSGLTSITIPNSVTSIGNSAFSNCSGLTSVTIPNSVTSIGWSAFNGVDCPTVVSLIEKPFKITGKTSDSRTFTQNTFNNATLYVPKGTIEKYKATDGWKDFLFIEEGEGPGGDTPEPPIPEPQKCATPTISYVDGKLTFDCETEGVEYVSSITPPSAFNSGSKTVSMPTTYKVTVYATKDGYENSDEATKEIEVGGTSSGIRGDVNEDGTVNGTDIQEVINIIVNAE